MTSLSQSRNTSVQNIVIWTGIFAAAVALAVYIYLGTFTRYMADDYCLLVDLNHGNLFTASYQKYLSSSNRFSNLFIIGVGEIFGHRNILFVPGLLILLWVAGLTWLGDELKKLFNLSVSWPVVLLAAELVAVLTIYQLPNLFQSVYWRPGQVTYFTPIVLFTFLAAGLVRASRLQVSRSLLWLAPLFAFFAFFIGGLSETIGALHIAAIILAILGVVFSDMSQRRKPALILLVATLVGALLAMIAMFFAPSNALRLDANDSARDLSFLINRTWQYGLSFNLDTLQTRPIPSLISVILGFLLTFTLVDVESQKKDSRVWLGLILIPLIDFILIWAIVAPSAYGQSYPVERVRLPAHYTFTLALISLGFCLGYLTKKIYLPNSTRTLALAFLAITLLYPLWAAKQTFTIATDLHDWSTKWDARETFLYDLIAQGQTDLTIPALPGMYSTKELDVRPYYWVNRCAAQYYGVNSIRAIPAPDEYFNESLNQ